jgi:hypothetical protein
MQRMKPDLFTATPRPAGALARFLSAMNRPAGSMAEVARRLFGKKEPAATPRSGDAPAAVRTAPLLPLPDKSSGAAGAARAAVAEAQAATLRADLAAAREMIASLRTRTECAERERDEARAAQNVAEKARAAADAQAVRSREEITAEVRSREISMLAAAAGCPATVLPPADPGRRSEGDGELTALREEMQRTKDPAEAGRLAAQVVALRDSRRAAAGA